MIIIMTSKTSSINNIITNYVSKESEDYLSLKDKDDLYNIIIEKQNLDISKYIEKIQLESDDSEDSKQLSFSFMENYNCFKK